jgi:hypothetical protein
VQLQQVAMNRIVNSIEATREIPALKYNRRTSKLFATMMNEGVATKRPWKFYSVAWLMGGLEKECAKLDPNGRTASDNAIWNGNVLSVDIELQSKCGSGTP